MRKAGFFLCCFFSLTTATFGQQPTPTENQEKKRQQIIEILAQIKQKYQRLEREAPHSDPAPIVQLTTQEEEIEIERFAPGEELFLSMEVDKYRLGDVIGIKTESGVDIGLSTLIATLDFNLTVNEEFDQVEGWFIQEGNTFALQVQPDGSLLATIRGEQFSYPQPETVLSDDLYINLDHVAQWFGLSYNLDYKDLRLLIGSQQTLPVMARLARRNRNLRQYRNNQDAEFPDKGGDEYQMWSLPTLDAQTSLSYDDQGLRGNYSVLGSRDLAYFNSRFFVTGNEDDIVDSTRLIFQREDQTSSLLGPLKASVLEFGDITGARVGNGQTTAQSRGVRVSNSTQQNAQNSELTNITGEILPEWDVELYRNGVLLDQRLDVQTGRFEFNDIPLLLGQNDFELVYYGPQGQVRREQRPYLVDGNSRSERKVIYNVSLENIGRTFLGINDQDNPNTGYRINGNYSYNASNWLSLNWGHTSLFDTPNDNSLINLGANTRLSDNWLFGVDYTHASNGVNSTIINTQGLLGKQALNFQYQADSENDSALVNQDRYNLTISGAVWQSQSLGIAHQTQLQKRPLGLFQNATSLINNLSLRTSSFTLNNSIDVSWLDSVQVQGDDEDPTYTETRTVLGSTGLQRNFGPVFARIAARYQLHDDPDLTELSGQFSFVPQGSWRHALDFSHDFTNSFSRYSFESTYNHDAYFLSTRVVYDDINKWLLGLTTRFSLGLAGTDTSEQIFMTRQPLATRGSLIVRVFHDLNANKRYDEGEPLLPDVEVSSKQLYGHAVTNQAGLAALTSMPTNRQTDILIERDTLPDAYMIPAIEGISISPRSGFVDAFDYPVVVSSETEGVVYVTDSDGKEQVAPYVPIQLIDTKGQIVKEILSEFDGYYFIDAIPPGEYQLQIAPNYIATKRLNIPLPIQITAPFDGDLISGQDFALTSKRQVQGYVASLGEFEDLSSLKFYWRFLTDRLDFMQSYERMFYWHLHEQSLYQLNLAFLPNQQEAQLLCDKMQAHNIQCDVKPFTLLM